MKYLFALLILIPSLACAQKDYVWPSWDGSHQRDVKVVFYWPNGEPVALQDRTLSQFSQNAIIAYLQSSYDKSDQEAGVNSSMKIYLADTDSVVNPRQRNENMGLDEIYIRNSIGTYETFIAYKFKTFSGGAPVLSCSYNRTPVDHTCVSNFQIGYGNRVEVYVPYTFRKDWAAIYAKTLNIVSGISNQRK